MRKKITFQVKQKVKELSDQGIEIWAIRERLGLSITLIYSIRKQLGLVKTRNRRQNASGGSIAQKETVVNRSGTTSPGRDDRLHKDS